MFSHRSFLLVGDTGAIDILSLIRGGNEILDCHFSFEQGINDKGKASTRVYSGKLYLTLSQLPPQNIIEWSLDARKYSNGAIISVNDENIPIEKIFFEHATCVEFEVSYEQKGESYTYTKLVIQAEKIIVGSGIDFNSDWSH